MKVQRVATKAATAAVVALIGIFALQACIGIPRPATNRPFIVGFAITDAVQAQDVDQDRFIVALEKFAIRDQSKIKVNNVVIWPPKPGQLTTAGAVTARPRGASAGSIWGGTRGGTRLPQTIKARPPRTTQHIAFKDDSDLRKFMNFIAER